MGHCHPLRYGDVWFRGVCRWQGMARRLGRTLQWILSKTFSLANKSAFSVERSWVHHEETLLAASPRWRKHPGKSLVVDIFTISTGLQYHMNISAMSARAMAIIPRLRDSDSLSRVQPIK